MMGFNLPHRANVGEIVRVRDYEGVLFLITEHLEEVSHDKEGSEPCVTYTGINIDNRKEVKIIFDEDVLSIVVTADKSDDFIARRQGQAQPPAVQKPKSVNDMLVSFVKQYEEEKKRREGGKNKSNMNAPRSPWAKEREEKRKAYEYIDFLLERYGDLISMQQAMPHDAELHAEIDLIKAEFMEKTGEKIIQDGKFS